MDLGLSGKTALVTGASSGIGAATARLLAEEGADVIVAYGRDEAGASRTAEAVRACGRAASVVAVDVGDGESVRRAFAEVGRIVAGVGLDVVVFAAGRNVVTPLADLSFEEWDEVVRVNLHGVFYGLREAGPLMNEGSAIVTVASVAAVTGAAHHAHYAAAKAGVVNLTKSAARALAPRVRVNCVSPGITRTPMGEETLRNLAPGYAEEKLLARRVAEPGEVARCVAFLASPLASFVYGATLDVNGGRDLR